MIDGAVSKFDDDAMRELQYTSLESNTLEQMLDGISCCRCCRPLGTTRSENGNFHLSSAMSQRKVRSPCRGYCHT